MLGYSNQQNRTFLFHLYTVKIHPEAFTDFEEVK